MKLLDIRIDSLSEAELTKEIRNILRGSVFQHIATVNPEFLVEAQKNEPFNKLLNSTHLNVCDGFGISLWTKFLYKIKIIRIPGVQVAEMICQVVAEEGKSVYLLGGFGVVGKAAQYLVSQYPNLTIAGHQDGSPGELSQDVINAQPDVILVAFGSPAQEFWIQEHGKNIPNCKIGIGIGGTFDFWAGKAKRAPKFMQKIGLEWLWRLILEPRRWQRIWTAVITFSVLVLREKFGNFK